MNKILATMAIGLLLATGTAAADKRVKGYVTKRGTYVAPHYQTRSNSTKTDNYSSKPNSNPYTGKKGYVNPYAPKKRKP